MTPREAAILEFEGASGSEGAAKDDRVAAVFGLSPTRYYQLVNKIIDDPAAVNAKTAQIVARLHRLRAARAQARREPMISTRAGRVLVPGPRR